jgi:putative ABC transport system permease protein
VNIDLQGNKYETVYTSLNSTPGVSKISACDYIPITGRSEGISLKKSGSKEEYKTLNILKANENFADNLELKFVAGRNLSPGKSFESNVVVNESAAKIFGYKNPSEIIGQSFQPEGDSNSLVVIGVVKDFKLRLDQDAIDPMVLQNQSERFRYLNVRIASNDIRTVIASLENQWKLLDAVHPFKYRFFDEQIAATSQGFFDVVSILGFISFIAITIACLGLLGMATYSTERRMKEVGIRKVLGAKNFGISLLLSKEFLKILLIAILIAAPLSYILNNLWLRKFPNRVEFGFGTVILGTLILLLLGLITIASQTINASLRKPVDSLRRD